jgi:CheY-like chemotaxis protein
MAVLVVEDEVLIRIDTAEELRQAGYRVLEASSADEALELLALGHEIDVIFSDVHMPGRLNGVDLLEVVTTRYPSVAVILTSATMLKRDGLVEGVDFIPKPYSLESVLKIIGRHARRDDDGGGG